MSLQPRPPNSSLQGAAINNRLLPLHPSDVPASRAREFVSAPALSEVLASVSPEPPWFSWD